MGKTVYDTALLLGVIAGKDTYDATSSSRPVPDFTKDIDAGVKGLKIGLCYVDHPKLHHTPVAEAIQKAASLYESLGASVELVPISETLKKKSIFTPDFAIGVYTVVQRSEVSSNLARYDGIRYGQNRSYFGDEAKRRIMLGTFTLSHGYADRYYVHAQKVRSMYIQNYQDLFSHYDLLISPTSPGYAQPLGASAGNPMFGELEDMLLEPSSIAGLPGINVPCFCDSQTNLYLGMNIIAKQWDEVTLLKAAYAYEQNTAWNTWAVEERAND